MSSQISSNNERPKLTQPTASRKRKDSDGIGASPAHMPTKAEPSVLTAPLCVQRQPAQPAGTGNRLLAGYLAHEFLTKGTLFGKRWSLTKEKQSPLEMGPGKPPTTYPEVAHLLKREGAHVPGVVNPTQLARWLQLQETGGAPKSESAHSAPT